MDYAGRRLAEAFLKQGDSTPQSGPVAGAFCNGIEHLTHLFPAATASPSALFAEDKAAHHAGDCGIMAAIRPSMPSSTNRARNAANDRMS